ncbi:hypothetical protein ACFFSW_07485 [Saccharothrix longispora]|uniref:Alpha-amylase n=1 Tax=Saccharothrix longispora TaxID=33920 RepID=A0ABU1PMB7_9PSEU|nr:hypothetical protein [Saccharothrix longispora]MDR6591805.1 hypothetical protein [Saccharothrix longispora]
MAVVLAFATTFSGTAAWAQETEAPTVTDTPTETTTTAPAVETPTTTAPTTTAPPEVAQPEVAQPESPVDTTAGAAPEASTGSPAAGPEQHHRSVDRPAPAPQRAAGQAAEADLRITAVFDRAEYSPESDLPITVTVDNVGDEVATETTFVVFDGNVWLNRGWEQISGRYTLAPGERMVVNLVARPRDSRADHAVFNIRVFRAEGTIPDPTPADNEAIARANVVQERGAASGVVYTDADGNGRADAGEGVSGLEFFANGGSPYTSLSAVTDGEGRISFTDVPTGRYRIHIRDTRFVVKPGFGEFTVERGATANLAIPTAAPVSDVLTARLELDEDTYGRDDQVNVEITLTNSGAVPLTGVVATCNHSGEPHVLDGRGPGWAPLVFDGPGTTVGAGETKVLVIPDVVPRRAYELGVLHAECNFGDHGDHEDGYVGSSDSAEVVGARGGAEGTLHHYSGQGPETPLAGVRLLALDGLGRPIAGARSGDDGTWRFDDLPAGNHDVLVLGPYRSRYGGGFGVQVDGGHVSSYSFSVVDGPVVVEPLPKPDVRVTASFDKPSYDINEQAKVVVKVVNVGNASASARFVPEWGEDRLNYDNNQWGDLSPWSGAHLEPGAERDITLVGTMIWVRGGVVRLKGVIETADDADPSDNVIDVSAAVTHRTGDAVVVVYGDRDLDGVFDDGEELPRIRITFEGGTPRKWVVGETGADGRFLLDDAPAGTYEVYTWDDNTGWVVRKQPDLVVTAGQETTVVYRMVRPLSDELHASGAFDRETYGVDDRVRLTITLSNSGDAPIMAKAFCGSAELPALHSGPAWGPLAQDGAGVEIAPGETRTFTIQETVPEWADDYGMFGVWCDFGPDHAGGLPSISDLARVPGAVWTVSGRALAGTGTDPAGIPGVKLVLLDFLTGQPVARTVTGADGGFTFTDLPVGYYTPVLVGPWKFNTNWGPYAYFKVIRGHEGPVNLHFDAGPEVTDPDVVAPTSPGRPAPVPTDPGRPGPDQPGSQAGPGPSGGGTAAGGDLADTGTSVIGLGLLGLLAVALGVGARVVGRRRTA